MAAWHVVSNEVGGILAVYGSALLSEAQEKCREIEHALGLPIFLHSVTLKERPCVGGSISMRGMIKRAL